MNKHKDPVISTKDLTKIFTNGTEIKALNKVNTIINRGEFVVVMGPSGSGKSTLLNLMGTLDDPTSGKVIIEGIDLGSLSGNTLADFRRKHIGFVFQLFNLIPTLSAQQNVMLPLIPYKRDLRFDLRERSQELLVSIGLEHRLDHLPGQLSGGEQQRVAIARALINEPSIILADEPTGNLDTRVGDEIMELFKKINKNSDRTVVVVTHSPRIAVYAERVYFLKDGFLVDESRLNDNHDMERFWSLYSQL